MRGLTVNKDIAAGIMLAGFGATGVVLGRELSVGSAANMGPGYLPNVVSGLLVVIGCIVAGNGLLGSEEAVHVELPLRPVAIVCGSLLLFMVLLMPFGLIASVAGCTAVAALGRRPIRLFETTVLAVVLATGSVLIFVFGLGLPMPVWPEF